MALNLLVFQTLANSKRAKFDSTTKEVRQAFDYLRNNNVAIRNISNYKDLLQTIVDTQAFDLRYKSLIRQKINQVTLEGRIPTKHEMNAFVTGIGSHIKSRAVMFAMTNYSHEVTTKAVVNTYDEVVKEILTEAIQEIKTNNPKMNPAQEEDVKKRINKVIESKLMGDPIDPGYKIDSEAIKTDFDKTNNVDVWAKKNNLQFSTNELDELKKGYNDVIVDKAIAQKETDVNACNKVISDYFEKNVSRISDVSFEKDLIDHINKSQATTYATYASEINNLMKERKDNFIMDEKLMDEKLRKDVAAQEELAKQKTQSFIDDPNTKIHDYSNLKKKDILDNIGKANPDIEPYLLNNNLTFPRGMPQEEIDLLRSKKQIVNRYSDIVHDFYHPKRNKPSGDNVTLGTHLRIYNDIKKQASEQGILLPFNKQCVDLDKFYGLLKNHKLLGRLSAGRRISQLYKMFDSFSFGALTRNGQAEKWIDFSRKWFGESSGDFTDMLLNNKIKGRTKQTLEQSLGKFVETAGTRVGGDGIVWNIRKAISKGINNIVDRGLSFVSELRGSMIGAGQKALVSLGKTALGKAVKAIVGAVGGAFTAGVLPAVMAVGNMLKKYVSMRDKLLKGLGINMGAMKRWAKNTFGSTGQKLIGAGMFILELPLIIGAAIGMALMGVGVAIAIVFVGILIQQFMMTGMTSSLVPPQFYDVMEKIGIKKGKQPDNYELLCHTKAPLDKRLWFTQKDNIDVCGTREDPLNPSDDTSQKCDRDNESSLGLVDFKLRNGPSEQCYLEKHVLDMYYQLINAAITGIGADGFVPPGSIHLLKIDYGYRDYKQQVEMWNYNCQNTPHKSYCPVPPKAGCEVRTGPYFNYTACPGTSWHQTGTVIDFAFNGRSNEAYEWLVKNASYYGFTECKNIPSCNKDEPYHWEYYVPNSGIGDTACEDVGHIGMQPPIPIPPMP